MKNPTHSNLRPSHNLISRFACSSVCFSLLLAALALMPSQAQAQATPNPPGQISYQGFLTDANGVALATNAPKNYVVTFIIYDAATGGNIKWAENQTVTVDRGYFSVLLGAGTASGSSFWTNNLTSIFSGPTASARYVGLTVNGLPGQSTPAEIQPRLQLLASPYSLLAANANALSDNAGVQVITSSGPSIGINETPNGADSLDVKGTLGINGSSVLQFGQGLTGQDPNAGKIGYEAFDNFALDIVGAGTANNRKIKLWAEAGTSTTGPLGVEIDTPAAALEVVGGGFFGLGSGLASAGNRKGVSVYYDSADNVGQIQAIQPGVVNENLTLNANGGNVGIGILVPLAKLHVSGTTYLDGYLGIAGTSTFETGRGISGKQVDAGKIGYGLFTANTLDIVGGGTSGTTRAIKLWGEGGTTMTGPLTTQGVINAPQIAAGGGGVASGDVFSLNGVGHYNNFKMYLRSGGDFNHWLGYDGVYEDGPGLYGYGGGVLGTSVGGNNWALQWNSSGNVYTRGILYAYGAVYQDGGVSVFSDRNVKQDFEDVDPTTVLDQLAALPITKWSFTNSPSVRHIGPIAQDFAAAFEYGRNTNDERHISLTDEVGVSLAAIKGLNERIKEKDTELDALKKQVADLKAVVDGLVKARNP